jgi:gliding motility-associated-like protein
MINYKYFAFTCLFVTILLSSVISSAQSKKRQRYPAKNIAASSRVNALPIHTNASPVITPRSNLIFKLDNSGQATLQLSDIATVTGATDVSIDRSSFNCSSLGDQVITVKAKGAASGPSESRFNLPYGIGQDAAGNIYIADAGNYRIRKIDVNGNVSTFAGNGDFASVDGPVASAAINGPTSLAVAPDGTVYFTEDGTGAIRKISNGVVTTIVRPLFVSGITVDKNGDLYATIGRRLAKMGADGAPTYLTGTLGQLGGLDFGPDDNLYFTDYGDHKVYKYTRAGELIVVARDLPFFLQYVDYINGNPVGNYAATTVDSQGNVFIANGYVVWKVLPDGAYSLFAGTNSGFKDGQGTDSEFSGTWGIFADKDDNLFLTDYRYSWTGDDGNHAIRKITPAGLVSTLAGGVKGYLNGSSASNEVTRPIHVQIITQPAINALPDATLQPNANCQAVMPNYIPNAAVFDICNTPVNVTQTPVAGTIVNAGAPVTVTLTAAGNFGGSASTSFKVTVAAITPSITIQADKTSACAGSPVIFTALPVNKGSNPQYQWLLNNVAVGTNTDSYTNSALLSTDEVTCVLTNNDVCVTTHMVPSNALKIMINQPVTSSVTVTPSVSGAVCYGTAITFTASVDVLPLNPVYQWRVNGNLVGTNNPVYGSSSFNDQDIITCTLAGNQPCLTAVPSNPYQIAISPLPTVAFAGDVSVLEDNEIQLNPVITGTIATYLWTPSAGLSNATVANPVARPTETTIYHLLVTTAAGCTDEASVKVSLVQEVLIPTAFTPNGDGVNDKWEIPALSSRPGATVNVFNRYGQPVFESKGYTSYWDGTYSHKPLPAGVYYYLIDLKDKSPKLSGYLTIIR